MQALVRRIDDMYYDKRIVLPRMIAKYLITIMFDISGFFNPVKIARVLLPNEFGFMAIKMIMTLTPQRKHDAFFLFFFIILG